MPTPVHGTLLIERRIERLVRQRIVDSLYYKQHCFGLNAESLIDKAASLEYVGGTFGAHSAPSPFLCLLYRMLNLNLDLDIVLAFIHNDHYKYLRILGAFYFRLVVEDPLLILSTLEPLLSNYSRIVVRRSPSSSKPHGFHLSSTDVLIDDMLSLDFMFSLSLPSLPSRPLLASQGRLSSSLRDSLIFSLDPSFLSFLHSFSLDSSSSSSSVDSHRLFLKGNRVRKRSSSSNVDVDDDSSSLGFVPSSSSDFHLSLSVSDTNALRLSLGLPPLR
mmetsp:Transcript_4525/g.6668  ORF Transcript_4525/g.6668 Transcript_4525/m.6668 type:complete len:274 (-) Transcript_4525:71-892(-)